MGIIVPILRRGKLDHKGMRQAFLQIRIAVVSWALLSIAKRSRMTSNLTILLGVIPASLQRQNIWCLARGVDTLVLEGDELLAGLSSLGFRVSILVLEIFDPLSRYAYIFDLVIGSR